MKFEIFNFKKVTSTNDKAIDLIKKKEKETGCVYAAIQTRGRGTHGKRWISNVGNLFISIFFPIKKNFPTFQEFTIISPIIVFDARFIQVCVIAEPVITHGEVLLIPNPALET